jgi:CPA1 family monovalent cation:H+ antiporter
VFSLLDLCAILLGLAALSGWINRRMGWLPRHIGLLLFGVGLSIAVAIWDWLVPSHGLRPLLTDVLSQIDFTSVVLNGLLAFLLFAGAYNVDVAALRERARPVALLALAVTSLSAILTAAAVWGVSQWTAAPLSVAWACVFAALISPTDPIGVMTGLRTAKVPPELDTELQGEALFNDGIGLVLFTAALAFAMHGSEGSAFAELLHSFLVEACGGLLLGTATGYVAYRGMKQIDDFGVEVMITLALVTATYSIALHAGLSGPLAVVAAGLLIGDSGQRLAMSDRTRRYVGALWTMIDEVLNSVLFLLIGLEVLVLELRAADVVLALAAIPVVVLARGAALLAPLSIRPLTSDLSPGNVPFLTWAGIRGGVSVALALSLPPGAARSTIVAATYGVVLFSVVVQGGTLGALAARRYPQE